MPLDLSLAIDASPAVSLEEALLRDLPSRLGVTAPLWRRLEDSAYGRLTLGPAEVESLAAETDRLRERWVETQRERVIIERRIAARDPEQRRALADRVLAVRPDEVLVVLDQLVALCRAATSAGAGLFGVGD